MYKNSIFYFCSGYAVYRGKILEMQEISNKKTEEGGELRDRRMGSALNDLKYGEAGNSD